MSQWVRARTVPVQGTLYTRLIWGEGLEHPELAHTDRLTDTLGDFSCRNAVVGH